MKNMTESKKMEQAIKIKDYMETHDAFVKDMVSLSTLFKYSINFDKNANLMDRDYDLVSIDAVANTMAGIDCTLDKIGAYKKDRHLHDVMENERLIFCNMKMVTKYGDDKTGVALVIDNSIKYDHDVKTAELENDRKIIFVLIGKHYMDEYLSLLMGNQSEMIVLMTDTMKKFVETLYPEEPKELSIPVAVSTLFMTVSSFHSSLFEDTLFKDEEFGWFYEDLLGFSDYRDMTLSNLAKTYGIDGNFKIPDYSDMTLEEAIVSSRLMNRERYNELSSFIDAIIDPIGEFFKDKPLASEDRKRMIKRHDYMLSKKSRYIKNVEIDEWLDTPLYLTEFTYNDDVFVIAVSDCISKPVFISDFCDDTILVAVPGNLNNSDKELMVIAYNISKLIAEYVYEDDEEIIINRTMSGTLGTALKMDLKINPELFDLLPDDSLGIKETIQEMADII